MYKENIPDPNTLYPVPGYRNVMYVKPSITNPNIIVGDFTYFSGSDFEKQVIHHYDFYGDKLIIGKFCQIAADVTFVMNGANHQMNAPSTFPFYIFHGWKQDVPPMSELPCKGDTVIGNDVWLGQHAVIMPGVHIGNGAIIGFNSTVAHDIPPYSIAVGNPAHVVRRRFDDELIALLDRLCWWDLPVQEIDELIPLLSCSDLAKVKRAIAERLGILTDTDERAENR